jgi:hypothetical protein
MIQMPKWEKGLKNRRPGAAIATRKRGKSGKNSQFFVSAERDPRRAGNPKLMKVGI